MCQDVTCSNMQAVWKYLLPHCINDVLGFNPMEKIIVEITAIGSNIGFEMAIENVWGWLESQVEELCKSDLQLDQQYSFEEAEDKEGKKAKNIPKKIKKNSKMDLN